jgi:transposase-like protein/ribosomal protein L24E
VPDLTAPSGYDHRRDEVVSLWHQGLSAPKITEATDIPVHRVRILLAQGGINLETEGHRSAVDQYRHEIASRLVQGDSIKKIALDLGRPYQTVLKWTKSDPELVAAAPTATKHHQVQEAIVRNQAGEPIKGIAPDFGVSPATLSRWLRAEGYSPSAAPAQRVKRETKRDVHLEKVLALHAQKMNISEIGRQVGVHHGTVGEWLRQEGLAPIYAQADANRLKTRSEKEAKKAQAISLYLEGMSVVDVAQEIHANRSSVHRWIDKAGVRHEGGYYLRQAQGAEEAVRLYTQERMSISDIMTRLGSNHALVKDWLLAAGVEIRSAWEQRSDEDKKAFTERGKTARLGRTMSQDQIDSARARREVAQQARVAAAKTEPKSQPLATCALDGCDEVVLTQASRFCSLKCRSLGQGKRQPDPTKQVTFICETCEKSVTKRRIQGKVFRFCSNQCAKKHTKTVRHYVARDQDMVLDSAWEMAFASTCIMLKIPVERYDRAQAIEYTPGHHYGPDFYLPGANLYVEIKGQQDPEDAERWAAFRAAGNTLAVLDGDALDLVRRAGSREILLDMLGSWS